MLKHGPTELAVPRLPLGEAVAFIGEHAAQLDTLLLRDGAVRLRGIGADTPEAVAVLARVLLGERVFGYAGGDSPRTRLNSRVYTSTEFPSEYPISLHNELSYAGHWPARVLFCCATPPDEGGATPIADSRAILADLDPAIVDEFDRRGVTYTRNLHDGVGFGRSWRDTFETSDRELVERLCGESGAAFSWAADGGLRLRQTRPALQTHPQTGERVWFNQADQFHPSTYPPAIAAALLELAQDDPDAVPSNATFGDGGPIPTAMLAAIRATTERLSVTFRWERGDALLLDNVLTAHGREAYRGARRILVAMA